MHYVTASDPDPDEITGPRSEAHLWRESAVRCFRYVQLKILIQKKYSDSDPKLSSGENQLEDVIFMYNALRHS